MYYNILKNKQKSMAATTSMSGRYPDAIKCENAILFIVSVDEANLGVTYRVMTDFTEN